MTPDTLADALFLEISSFCKNIKTESGGFLESFETASNVGGQDKSETSSSF